jgi:hypothetical protein
LIRKNPFQEFASVRHSELGLTVHENCFLLPLQGDTSKLGDEGFLVLPALDDDFQTFFESVGRLGRGLVFACHCRNPGLMLAG